MRLSGVQTGRTQHVDVVEVVEIMFTGDDFKRFMLSSEGK